MVYKTGYVLQCVFTDICGPFTRVQDIPCILQTGWKNEKVFLHLHSALLNTSLKTVFPV